MYEVVNIVNPRNNRWSGKLEYCVEWKGYEGTDEAMTWEPKDHVVTAIDCIENFHMCYPDKPLVDIAKPRQRTVKEA